ncbi:MAG: PfkB family carbohydrate kinase [Culicoidibacterales bacterium]
MADKVLTFGEFLIRFTPTEQKLWEDGLQLKSFYGGSEANVATTLSSLGLQTKIISAVPSNSVGESVFNYFSKQKIEMDAVKIIGQKVGTYYASRSFGIRPAEVVYDRQGSSFTEFTSDMLNFEQAFEGVTWFHFSGITAAINPQIQKTLTRLLSYAQSKDITISMDLNYRSKMWSFKRAKAVLSQFAPFVDVCFGIEPLALSDDDKNVFDSEGATEKEIKQRMESLKKRYGFSHLFHTKRSISAQNINTFEGYLLNSLNFEKSQPTATLLFERIGSGDAFVSGAIYGIIHKCSDKETLTIACQLANLKCTLEGDHLKLSTLELARILSTKSHFR